MDTLVLIFIQQERFYYFVHILCLSEQRILHKYQKIYNTMSDEETITIRVVNKHLEREEVVTLFKIKTSTPLKKFSMYINHELETGPMEELMWTPFTLYIQW